ncbi:MAG: PAS domain S-box protein [Bacteroidetes bacterium]|nr:PAS domain S-box protein [Bacteroidota bacterium]
MDNKKIKILLLEDDQDDAWQISHVLKQQNLEFELTLVGKRDAYLNELIKSPPDIILSDHYFPAFSSSEALDMVKDLGLNIPFILVTGAKSEDLASLIMKSGASDYILKDRLQRLPSSVLSVMQKFRSVRLHEEAELKIQENEKKYASLIQHLPANIAILNKDGIIVDVNKFWKLFADENGFKGNNYGIGTNYIEASKGKPKADNGEDILIEEAIEKITKGELTNFSMIYSCHYRLVKKWFKVIVSRENDECDSGIIIMHIDVTEQQEAQLNVKKSEANLLSIFNNTGIAFILLDIDLKIVSYNKTARLWANDTLGFKLMEGVNLISLIPEDKKKLSETAMKHVLSGKSFDKDDSYTMMDGSTKWFRVRMNEVNNNNHIIGICLSATDITEQVLSRKKVEQSEKRFQSLIENSTDIKTLATQEGKIIYASPSATKSLGYSQDEFLKTPAIDMVFKEDVPGLVNKMQELVKFPGKSFSSQHRLVHKNGRLIWCEGTMTNMLHEPSIKAFVSNFRNITERKNLEVLYQKANRLARLGSWEMDLQHNRLYWSEITKEIHEIDSNFEPDLETAINFYKEGLSRDTISDAIIEATTSGKAWDVELQIVTAKQNERWVRVIGEVEFVNGNCTRIFGSFQDIESRKKAEIERNRIASDLLKHVENLEQFAYIVSHNLRAPVANILGLANVLKNKLSDVDRERGQKYLFTAAAQMDETIKDLNKILQIRTEYSEFKEPVYLPGLLKDIESSIQNIMSKENVIIYSAFSNASTITTIKSYMHSIFYNLIINSIKYRKKGVNPIIEIRTEMDKEKVRFIFNDNGTGIDLEKHGKKIFGLYKRFHMEVEGKGLGLFMIKTQIEVLGGSITVKSKPNEGAEFTVELPYN